MSQVTASGMADQPQTIICVFCGSSPGKSPLHIEAARSLGTALAKHNIKLIYGGGHHGLMGEIAKTVVSQRGPDAVLGVRPQFMIKRKKVPTNAGGETASSTAAFNEDVYGRMVVVPDMHTRKQRMVREVLAGGPGSGFVALSGGYGTMDELMEMANWVRLGLQHVGICVFNVDGFFDELLAWISKAVDTGFMRKRAGGIIVEAKTADGAIEVLKEYKAPEGQGISTVG